MFVSYAHRENDPACPCNSCRWERHCAFECPRCEGDGVEPEVPGYTNCWECNGTGQRNADKAGL